MRTPFLGTTLLLLGTASPTALTTSVAAQDLPAPDPITCEDWGSYDFFAWASADTVASCLRAGADPVALLDESGGTPLHHAARATPDPAVIAVLVQAGADPNAPDLNGGTPLHEAARSNSNPGIIAALLEAGADLDAPDSRGNTPLHSAWSNPRAGLSWQPPRINPAAVQELLRSGADPLARNDNGLVADPTNCELWHTPVFARAADFAIYASCLESGADIGATDDNGNTVLHHSASNPDPAITTLLLGVGAGARTLNGAGTTPLHIAAQHENLAVVTTLLEAGAEVNATNDRGTTPLHGAARNGSPAVVLALLEAGADLNARTSEGDTPLMTAMGGMGRGTKPAIVDALLEEGADVNIPETFFGRTPLHESISGTPVASVNGITLKLLAHGADPNARSRFGGTPLHTAAYEHGPAVIRVLVEAGADPNVLDDDGESPLHPAARYGRPGTITALVNAGTDPNTANEDGEAPLHQAVSEGKTANVDALLEGGADANARTARGDTPLHLAAAPPDTTIVSALVNAGADVNARNLSGETPLHAAWRHDSPLVIGKLLELGADPEVEDDRGRIAGPTCDWGDYDFFRGAPVESVRGCVEVGTPIDSRDRVGRPLLHRLGGSLFSRGDVTIAIASLLLEAGADVNERDDRGSTPLHYAAGGTSDFVAALLEAGADVNARSSFGDTPLHRAAAGRNDRDTNISLLVRAGAEVDAQTDRGETPLHWAVANGNPAVAARLLDLGADPTLRDDSGSVADPVNCENWNTPTFFRIAAADVVAGCIADGADVNASTQQGQNVRTPGSTPLHLGSEAGRDTAVISLLLGAGAGVQARDSRNYSPLHKAAEGGTPSVVRALLQAGAEVDARAKGFSVDYGWDWTPLHLAAGQNADPEVAEALLAAGADLHARGDAGQTPLHQAALNENPAIAALLLEARADVNAKGSTGRTPLHEAAGRNPNPAVLAVLLDAGAELEARGVHPESHQRYGSLTPLHEAARTNANPEIVTALIEAGADVDGRVTDAAIPFRMVGSGATLVAQREGATPLHMAAAGNRNPAVIEALVRGGADLELRGRFGQTALHMAAMQNAAVFPVLLRLGADPAALDDEGKTPMDYARENGALQGLEEVRRLRGTPGASVGGSPPAAMAAGLALALTGASGPAESQEITIRSDSAGVEIVTSDPSRSDATCTLGDEPIFRVGNDESDEAQWFSTIRGVGRLSDGSVAVIDDTSAEIRIFDAAGRHLRSMGRHGKGPGEFRNAGKLWVLPGDTLWAGDYRPWRYNVFTSDGEWVRGVEMKPIYGNPSRSGGVLDNGVSPSAVVEAGGSTIATGRTSETEVRLLDDELRLRRILRWPDSDRDVSGADVRAWRDDYIESRGGRNSPNWSMIDDLVVSDDVPAADVFPAFSYVEIGRDGRVWVLPYRRPRAEATRLMGFDGDGGFLCHLEYSHSGLTAYEFGADYWLGVQADELGVETVVVYRLTTPGEG